MKLRQHSKLCTENSILLLDLLTMSLLFKKLSGIFSVQGNTQPFAINLFSASCPLKGHTNLKKPTAESCRLAEVYVAC